MDKLRAIQLFVRLADLGSFTRVADEISSSKSLISKEIGRLEESLGTRLLQRSTRNLQLTHTGKEYLAHCREILVKLEDAESAIQDLQDRPKGVLRINAPMALGITDLSTMFAEFMQRYPEIELDIHLGDEAIDLIEQGFDLGFRATSQLSDSNYIGKPLTHFKYRICASPSYLINHKKINRAADLKSHNCFIYSYFTNKNNWPLGDPEKSGVPVQGTLKVNNTIFMLEIIKAGLGIGIVPDFVCREAIESGEVVEVLPRISRPLLTLYALYPARQFVPPKLKYCIEFMDEWFKH